MNGLGGCGCNKGIESIGQVGPDGLGLVHVNPDGLGTVDVSYLGAVPAALWGGVVVYALAGLFGASAQTQWFAAGAGAAVFGGGVLLTVWAANQPPPSGPTVWK